MAYTPLKLNNLQNPQVYISLIIPESIPSELDQLEKLDKYIFELRTKYTEKDKLIQQSLQNRERLLEILKERAISFLKSEKLIAEAKMESALRPKGVILKYKSLVREASRDESTLIGLENQLRLLNLEEAKIDDPWELITQPTLLTNPVAPRRKIIGLFGLTFGLILGIIFSFYKEKNSDLIYEKEILEKKIDKKIIEIINFKNKSLEFYSNEIFLNEIINVNNNQVKFLTLGSVDKFFASQYLQIPFESNKKFTISENFNDLSNKDTLIAVTKLEMITNRQIDSFLNRLKIADKNLFGIILVK